MLDIQLYQIYEKVDKFKEKEAVLSELSRCIPRAKEFEVPPHNGHLTV
jgi:hypothetical protein